MQKTRFGRSTAVPGGRALSGTGSVRGDRVAPGPRRHSVVGIAARFGSLRDRGSVGAAQVLVGVGGAV